MNNESSSTPEDSGSPPAAGTPSVPLLPVSEQPLWSRMRDRYSQPRTRARIWRVAFWASALYVLLFTAVWDVLCGLVIGGAFLLVHLGTPADERPNYRPYVYEHPTFRAMCDFSNRVAELTHPLISDEAMIAHWKKHHKEWEAAVANAPGGNKTRKEYERFWKHLNEIGLEKLHYDPSDHPERFANLTPLDSLGSNQAHFRPCTGRGGSLKGYRFYPQDAPVILGDQVLTASSLEFARANKFQPEGNLLVESNDRSHYTYSMRPLSAHWFIMRWE